MPKPAVNIAVKAARAAGRVLIRLLNRTDSLSIAEKERNDFVTEADRQAEQAIITEIRKVYPSHAILSEEAGEIGQGEIRWIIDPLDGTQNFIHGLPHFCISIAQQQNGRIEHGVIYDPIREELFTASRGSGAFLNDRRMRVSDRRSLDGGIIATGFPFRARRHLETYLGMFRSIFEQASDVRRAGSAALDLAYVAAGRCDGFWEIGLKPWDMAAGALMIEEAGGMCLDFRGEKDYLETGNIIAGNLKVASALQQHIQPQLGDSFPRG